MRKSKLKKVGYQNIGRPILIAFMILITAFISLQSVSAKPKPLVWHDYEYFDLALSQGFCEEYSRECLQVTVYVTEFVYGDRVSVTIYVNSILKWSGELEEGESTPSITCNDKYTEVHIAHLNGDPPIRVKGYIDWVHN